MTSPLASQPGDPLDALVAARSGAGLEPDRESWRSGLLLVESFAAALGLPPTEGRSHREIDVVIPDSHGPWARTAIELKLWTAGPGLRNNLRNRIRDLLAQSVLYRRSQPTSVTLACVIALQPPANDTRAADDVAADLLASARVVEEQGRTLLRSADDVGFDLVFVGMVSSRTSWLRLVADGLEPLDGFATVRQALLHPPSESGRQTDPQHRRRGLSNQKLRWALVADEWRSSRGGISTFNRDLATELARRGHETCVVVPLVTNSSEAEAVNVQLVSPVPIPGIEGHQLLLTKPTFAEEDYYPDVIVGHGRVLGPYAYALQNQFFPDAVRVHIQHTDTELLEHAKTGPGELPILGAIAKRRREEIDLAHSADVVAGVGPLLRRSIELAMYDPGHPPRDVVDLTPGLPTYEPPVDPTYPRPDQHVLIMGRAEDIHSKGFDIAIQAAAYAFGRLGPGASKPRLIVRGIPAGKEGKKTMKRLRSLYTSLDITFRLYTDDADLLRTDLWQASAVLMPSRHEGFGLAAYEAIAAGVPALVTANSGLGELLTRIEGLNCDGAEVISVSSDDVGEVWGQALLRLLGEPRRAFDRAADVRAVLKEKVGWDLPLTRLEAAVLTALAAREAEGSDNPSDMQL